MNTQPIVVWTEIQVKDIPAAAKFYDSVLGFKTSTDRMDGPVALNDAGDTVGASLIEGPGGASTVLHFVVPDTPEAAAERVVAGGGTVLGEAIEIPPGRYILAADPDGNKLGLFQPRMA